MFYQMYSGHQLKTYQSLLHEIHVFFYINVSDIYFHYYKHRKDTISLENIKHFVGTTHILVMFYVKRLIIS